MSTVATKETLGFQADISHVLDIVINSLYSNKEIFLRELISNASDAADKLRFLALTNSALYEEDNSLAVKIDIDKEARTLTITDNGIGMSRDELVDHLGTIAKSGTREFLQSLSGDKAKDAQLIGQFGVGFYSAFIVADKVVVQSRRAGLPADQGACWESTGIGTYTVEMIDKPTRGTSIILHLKKDEDEFLEPLRLRTLIKKYSDHVPLPVMMKKESMEEDESASNEYENVNAATALWTLPKDKIQDAEYKELYKHIAHDFLDPLIWTHNKVEGNLQYILFLAIPSHAPYDLWNRDRPHGLKLYVQRVFIVDNAEIFLPYYLRFVKGIVDSSDLPLNISREVLQQNKIVDTMRAATTKRVLSMLEKLATEDAERYAKFWDQFGQVLKEGPAEDFANKEAIAKLLRFASTHHNTDMQSVSLDDYISRMKAGQEKIYYLTAENYNAAKNSPHLEIFRKKGIEVLLLVDRVDEWLVAHLTEYAGKTWQSVAKGQLDLGDVEDEKEKEEQKKVETEFADLAKQVKEVLGDKVKEVQITHRLTDSPSCLVVSEYDMGGHMQRLFKAAGHALPETKPILELNPGHPIVHRLKDEPDQIRFSDIAHLLLDQAVLAEGAQLEDPAVFIKRLNDLLLKHY